MSSGIINDRKWPKNALEGVTTSRPEINDRLLRKKIHHRVLVLRVLILLLALLGSTGERESSQRGEEDLGKLLLSVLRRGLGEVSGREATVQGHWSGRPSKAG